MPRPVERDGTGKSRSTRITANHKDADTSAAAFDV